MCGQIPQRFGEIGAAIPGTECCNDAVRTATRSMIQEEERCKSSASTERQQSTKSASISAGQWTVRLVFAIAAPTACNMSRHLQAWTGVYTDSMTLLNVSIFYKGMPGIAKARWRYFGMDERRNPNFGLPKLQLHISGSFLYYQGLRLIWIN